jgi:hypothetical protein
MGSAHVTDGGDHLCGGDAPTQVRFPEPPRRDSFPTERCHVKMLSNHRSSRISVRTGKGEQELTRLGSVCRLGVPGRRSLTVG